MEFSGLLRERVVIERSTGVSDGAGGLSSLWESVAVRWARVEPVERTQLSAVLADSRQTARTWRVTLRAGLEVTLDMRLRWRGAAMRLVGLETDPAQPDRMTLLAEELGR